jgi:hypothetical protein
VKIIKSFGRAPFGVGVASGYPLVGRFATGFATLRLPHATPIKTIFSLFVQLFVFQRDRIPWVGVKQSAFQHNGAHPLPNQKPLAKECFQKFI